MIRNQLIKACSDFRRAIELTPKDKLFCRFVQFPRGSCGDASPLLGLFLYNSGFGTTNYVCGEKNRGYYSESHAWLEKDGLYIDITGDQFFCRPPVYYGVPDCFFSRYAINRIRYPHPYNESLTELLLSDYKIICSHLI